MYTKGLEQSANCISSAISKTMIAFLSPSSSRPIAMCLIAHNLFIQLKGKKFSFAHFARTSARRGDECGWSECLSTMQMQFELLFWSFNLRLKSILFTARGSVVRCKLRLCEKCLCARDQSAEILPFLLLLRSPLHNVCVFILHEKAIKTSAN